jgi:hypothetical protein
MRNIDMYLQLTRAAIHGFQNLICDQTSVKHQCSEASYNCECKFCGEMGTQYHLAKCLKRVQALNAYQTYKSK